MNLNLFQILKNFPGRLKVLLIGIFIVLISAACILPSLPQQSTENGEQELISKAVEQTLAAQPSEAVKETPPPDTQTPPTDSPETPTPQMTATPEPSPTSAQPMLEISENTNCRYGPGVYDLIMIYLAGDRADLVGKNQDETFWYVSSAENPGQDCWLWGRYTTPVGDTDQLPVFTPPPTPTPSLNFSIAYEGSDCGAGSCWLWIRVNNSGGIKLESVRVFAKNTSTNDKTTNQSNTFKSSVGGGDISKAAPGAVVYTHTGQLPNPSGDKVNLEVTACSQDNLNGICLTRTISVKP
jgi:hypothetical protein